MAQPISRYLGGSITCYPGSNQTDDGKLQLEFNMARFITRLSSKNFCVVDPSFIITPIIDIVTNLPKLEIGVGQASINGMDLIMTSVLQIDPPETAGTYHLAFKLARDSSWNVLGDLIYGTTTTFEGVYLTYYSNKPETPDKDMLFIGQITWDGTEFSNIIEDEDKYGRMWAADILCEINDPKHINITKLNLQDWMDLVPDWYVSKEGDVEFGAIEFLPGRDGNGGTGVKIQATGDNISKILVKAPSTSSSDVNKTLEIIGNATGTSLRMGTATIDVNSADSYNLNILNTSDLNIRSNQILSLQGDSGIELGAGGNNANPKLVLSNHKATLTDNLSDSIEYSVEVVSETLINNKLGKATWIYDSNSSVLSLLGTDVTQMLISPNARFNQNIQVINKVLLGESDSLPQSTLSRTNWLLKENVATNGNILDIKPDSLVFINPTLSATDNAHILLKNTADTIHTKISDNAVIELLNPTSNPAILWKDGTVSYDVTLEKLVGQKKLNLQGNLSLVGLEASSELAGTGLTTRNGILTFARGTNNATITKDNNADILRTSGALSVGVSGTSALYAGTGAISSSLGVGASTYDSCKLKVDSAGNVSTSGTITGSKVFNAVYNDAVEFMEKEDYEEVIEAGDVVFFTESGKVTKWHEGISQTAIAGVVSSEETYGYALGGEGLTDNQKVPIGLMGRVFIKVSDTSIKTGDILAVDNRGNITKQTDTNKHIYTLGVATNSVKDNKVFIKIL